MSPTIHAKGYWRDISTSDGVQEGQTELLVSGLRRAPDRVKQSGCMPLLVKIGNRRYRCYYADLAKTQPP
jgi:hypothetical protein